MLDVVDVPTKREERSAFWNIYGEKWLLTDKFQLTQFLCCEINVVQLSSCALLLILL